MNAVAKLNQDDCDGPQSVKVWRYKDSGGWMLVQSLSRGDCYFYNPGEEDPKKNTRDFNKPPEELKGKSPIKEEWQDQNAHFPRPPSKFPKMRLINNIRTNSYTINGKILENEIHTYLVEFEPAIPTTEILKRRNIIFGDNKQQKSKNRQWLKETFGVYVFDNHQLYSMGVERKKAMLQQKMKPIAEKNKAQDNIDAEQSSVQDVKQDGQKEEQTETSPKKSEPSQEKIMDEIKHEELTNKNKSNIIEYQLHPNYMVRFFWQETHFLDSEDLPQQQQDALLNIFNRRRLQTAGYTRVGKGWFLKKNAIDQGGIANEQQQQRFVDVGNNCSILLGYECGIHVKPTDKGVKSTIFKADLISKCVTKSTVHDIINDIYNSCQTDEEFRNKVEQRLLNRHFVMSYNTQSRCISNIAWNETEDSTFELKSTGGKISYKKYLQDIYDLKSPKHEYCIIKDMDNSGFLSQHMKLTLRSDEMKDFYDQVLQETNQPADIRLQRTDAFVRYLNKADEHAAKNKKKKKKGDETTSSDESEVDEKKTELQLADDFTIQERGRVVTAAILEYPDIIYQGKQDHIHASITDFAWKETGGFLHNIVPLSQWAIVHDVSDEQLGEIVYYHWKTYCSMRKFDPFKGPIREPQVRPINFNDEKKYNTIVKNHDQILLVILPDKYGGGMRSSQIKSLFTKAIQCKYNEQANNKNKQPRCLIQCILASNAENKNAVIGTFEDMMGKIGNVLFKIEPKLPNKNKKIDIDSTWCMGMDVSHVGNKPSVAMLCLNRKPFYGTCKYLTLRAHLNKERKEIVPFNAMATMMYEVLEESWQSKDVVRNVKNLPKAIICFRDGVPDNRFFELYSKEVVGIQRGLRIFRSKYGLDKWKCKLNYFVVSKSILDKFGIEKPLPNKQFSTPQPLEAPCVIFDGITSSRIWDFIFYNYHPKKDVNKTKPLRYVCLRDELRLSEEEGSYDLWHYIYGLCFTFQFSIPFPLGGTAQVGPLVYAKHYAETFSQLITSNDANPSDLKIDTAQLPMRPGLVDRLLEIQSQDTGIIPP